MIQFSDALVSDLIVPSIPGWNDSIIDNLFPSNVAKVIKNIPLCPSLPPDKIFWNGSSNGLFSVRNAYHLGLDLLKKQKGECSFRGINADFWKKLWSLKVPNSSKIFLWRACQNLLPTKQNLKKKCVLNDDLCPCCKFQEESTLHALWSCPGAQDVWGSGSLAFQKCPSFFPGMCELLSFLFNRLDDVSLSLMVAVFRCIWMRRNKLIFEKQFSSPLSVFKEALRRHEEYWSALKKNDLVRQSHPSSLISSKFWKCPNPGYIKVNWDASLNVRKGVIGLGCVIRNSDGVIVGAKCYACKAEATPLLAECMAAYSALIFCKNMGFSSIICEGDSIQVVKAICDPNSSFVKIGHFVDAIRKEASDLISCSWFHCCREANIVAHQLAREASSKCLSHCWFEEMPLFISNASFRNLIAYRL